MCGGSSAQWITNEDDWIFNGSLLRKLSSASSYRPALNPPTATDVSAPGAPVGWRTQLRTTKLGKTPLGLEETHRDLKISTAEVAAELGRT
jgi:hypothetical protein